MNINANESCIYLAEKSWIKAQSNLKYAHCLFLLYLEYIFGVARFKLDICQNVVRISNAHVISDQCNKVKTAKKLYLWAHFIYERQNFCNSGCITAIRTVFLKALNRLQQGVQARNKFSCNRVDGYSLDNSRKTMAGSLFSLYLLKDLRSYNAWSDKNQLSDQKTWTLN